MSETDDFQERYEASKRRREELLRRKQKYDAGQEVAQQKTESLEAEIKELGIDPSKVQQWLVKERKRLDKELAVFDEQAAEVEAVFEKIETGLREASS